MSPWSLFEAEIARWRDAGREACLWWRDDDAADVTPSLERLLALRRSANVPLALAVVPATATEALAGRLAREPAVDLLQHGYAHVNHAPPSDKKAELGSHRPPMLVLGELGTGWLAMERLFGARGAQPPLPVLVPPWNRIAPALVPALPEIGFTGLSSFGPRQRPEPVRGLRQINTHVDLIDWQVSRAFVGEKIAVETLVEALAASRLKGDERGSPEPVGILSHHLAMDEGAWDFLHSLWGRTIKTPGVRTPAISELFASREARV